VISSELDLDNLRGTCTGTGRMKIRLNEGENREDIRANFTNLGVFVQDHKLDATKKSNFSTPIL